MFTGIRDITVFSSHFFNSLWPFQTVTKKLFVSKIYFYAYDHKIWQKFFKLTYLSFMNINLGRKILKFKPCSLWLKMSSFKWNTLYTIDFCYSWIPSLRLFFAWYFSLNLAKNDFTVKLQNWGSTITFSYPPTFNLLHPGKSFCKPYLKNWGCTCTLCILVS